MYMLSLAATEKKLKIRKKENIWIPFVSYFDKTHDRTLEKMQIGRM